MKFIKENKNVIIVVALFVTTFLFWKPWQSDPPEVLPIDPHIEKEQNLQDELDIKKMIAETSREQKLNSDRVILELKQSIKDLKIRNNKIENAKSKIDNSNSDIDDIISSLNRSTYFLIQKGYR